MHISIQSLGRSGSSMLHRIVKQSCKKAKVGKGHALAEQIPGNKVNTVIFLFGNPEHIIISLFDIQVNSRKHAGSGLSGNKFIKAHARNMPHIRGLDIRNPDKIMERITKEDVLNLEKMFDSFHDENKKHPWRLVTLRYETLWDNKEKLEAFLGTKLKLPAYKKRNALNPPIGPEKLEEIKNTYANLKKKIDEADDYREW